MSTLPQLRDRLPATWETIAEGVPRIHLPAHSHHRARLIAVESA